MEPLKANITLTIPQFNNVRTRLYIECFQTSATTGLDYDVANITSLRVVSAGRNLDALLSEFDLKSTLNGSRAFLDFGIVTNTGKNFYDLFTRF